jgi:hypothetical protein
LPNRVAVIEAGTVAVTWTVAATVVVIVASIAARMSFVAASIAAETSIVALTVGLSAASTSGTRAGIGSCLLAGSTSAIDAKV